MSKVTFKVDGVKEIEKKLKKIGKVPQKYVTKASKSGMNIALKGAKNGDWLDQTGEMRRGMKLVGEKSKTKGKKVYRVVFDRSKNDIFQKTSKSGKIAYYPASQNYGFYTKNGRYIPGFHFMEKGITENGPAITKKIISIMEKELNKELK